MVGLQAFGSRESSAAARSPARHARQAREDFGGLGANLLDHIPGTLDPVDEAGALATRQYAMCLVTLDAPPIRGGLADLFELERIRLDLRLATLPCTRELVADHPVRLARVRARDHRAVFVDLGDASLVVVVSAC